MQAKDLSDDRDMLVSDVFRDQGFTLAVLSETQRRAMTMVLAAVFADEVRIAFNSRYITNDENVHNVRISCVEPHALVA